MADKSDKMARFRPKKDDLDEPLFDHRNDAFRRQQLKPSSKPKPPTKSTADHPAAIPESAKKRNFRPSNVPRRAARSTGPKSSNPAALNRPQARQGQPAASFPQSKKHTNEQLHQRNETAKAGNDADNQHLNANESMQPNAADPGDPIKNNDADHNHDTNDHTNTSSKDNQDGQDGSKRKSDTDQDRKTNRKLLGDDQDDDHKDKDADHADDDKDKDQDGDQKDDQDKDKDKDDDANKSPLQKLADFATGKKKVKGKSLKELLTGEKAKNHLPKQRKGPIHNLKDLFDRVKNLVKRLFMLLKIYFLTLKAWLAFKLIALAQSILMLLVHAVQWIINLAVTMWTFFMGMFGTLGAITASFATIGAFLTLIAIAGAFITSYISNQQQDTELNEYKRICSNARPRGPDDGMDAVTSGSGSWKKKGTKEYKMAHRIFKSWVNRGLDGGAAAGIIGWVAHEGGDFSIIDRAEGHYGKTEKEAGISEGVVPIPSGNYGTGGGGIYQFTPYHKFEPLRSKKWLDPNAQTTQVTKELNKGAWVPDPEIVGVSFMQFAAMKDPVKAVLKWDGYEKGAIDPIMATAKARKADAKTAYKLFNGEDYHFDKKKVKSWFKPGTPGGVLDTGGSTPDDTNTRDPRCYPNQSQDDDDVSSNSIVKTAQKEVDEGRHPSGVKYCQWFGVSTGTPWCAIFVSWVLHHTKGYTYIPKNGAVSGFASYFKGQNEDRSYKTTPKPGWLIMFDWDGTHNSGTDNSHIGIVTRVKNGKISTIEGNDADNGDTITKALKDEYTVGDKRISMYAVPHKK